MTLLKEGRDPTLSHPDLGQNPGVSYLRKPVRAERLSRNSTSIPNPERVRSSFTVDATAMRTDSIPKRTVSGHARSGHLLNSILLTFRNQGLVCNNTFSTNAQSRFASGVVDIHA